MNAKWKNQERRKRRDKKGRERREDEIQREDATY